MNLLLSLFVVFPLLFFVPGNLVTRLLFRDTSALSLGEKIFISVSASIMLSTWVGLVLAEFGWFSLGLLCALVAIFCTLAWIIGRRTRAGAFPFSSPALRGFCGYSPLRCFHRESCAQPALAYPPYFGGPGFAQGFRWTRRVHAFRPSLASLRVDWVFVTVLILGALLAAKPAESILGNTDAGVYVNTGIHIARTGAIAAHDALVQALPADAGRQFFWDLVNPFFLYKQLRLPGFFIADPSQGIVLPQFLHLYPVWFAIFESALGLRWGLYATPIIGVLGSVAFYFLVRTLFDRNLARLAFFLLVITVPQFWFARYPVAEAMTQFLMLTGMYAFLRSRGLTLDASGDGVAGIGFPLMAGIAFAEVFLTRADSILLLPPLVAYGLIVIFARRWQREHWAFYLSLGAVLIHAFVHMWAFAPTYIYFQYSHFLRMKNIDKLLPGGLPSADDLLAHPGNYLAVVVAFVIVSLIALFVLDRAVQRLRRRWGPSLAQRVSRDNSILRWAGVAAVVALFLFAYFVWPHPATPYAYVGGETPDDRSANLIKLGWYLSPFALALALFGAAVIIRRDLNRHNAFFYGTAALFAFFYLEELYSNPHYIYTIRHYVPLIIPLFILLATRGIDILWNQRVHRNAPLQLRWRVVAGAMLGLWLLYDLYAMGLVDASRAMGLALRLPFVQGATRVGPVRIDPIGLSIVGHAELAGAFDQVDALAQKLDPNAVIIFSNNRDEPGLIAAPLYFLYDRDALVARFNQPNGEKVAAMIGAWRDQGREVILAYGTNGGKLAVPGYSLDPLGEFSLDVPQWAFAYEFMPRAAWRVNLNYALYRAMPETTPPASPLVIEFGGDDYPALVGGFLERAPEEQSRWMGVLPNGEGGDPTPKKLTATVRVPAAGDTTALDLAITARAAADGTQMSVTSGSADLGEVILTRQIAEYHLTLKRADLKREGNTFLLQFSTTAFIDNAGRALGAEFKRLVVKGE